MARFKVGVHFYQQHTTMWNTFGPADSFGAKNRVLDYWCARLGRDPAEIERTVMLTDGREVAHVDAYLAAGAQHLILGMGPPFDLQPVRSLLDAAGRSQ